jgi:hypothetical protein
MFCEVESPTAALRAEKRERQERRASERASDGKYVGNTKATKGKKKKEKKRSPN